MAAPSSRTFALALVTFATFTDIVAYSIAVPVLPDLTRTLGASPTTVGLLFASFGVTALLTAIPMGVVSDRIGRKGPLVAGFVGLAIASVMLAFADGLPSLFVARLAQGAADAVTWVVGLALVADCYDPAERGRASGIVMSGASSAFVIGPSLGGWMYELGGLRLPFLAVAAMSAVGAAAAIWLTLPPPQTRARAGADSVGAAGAGGRRLRGRGDPRRDHDVDDRTGAGAAPAAASASTRGESDWCSASPRSPSAVLHPLYGRLADRWGPRRLTLLGLAVSGCVIPALGGVVSFESAIPIFVVQIAALSLVIAPSLAYMAEATSDAGLGSFGVAYGLYNVAWGVGLLAGPAAGGFLFERIGLARLAAWWGPALIVGTLLLARVRSTGVGSVRLEADLEKK